jgi:hypothetical protein
MREVTEARAHEQRRATAAWREGGRVFARVYTAFKLSGLGLDSFLCGLTLPGLHSKRPG